GYGYPQQAPQGVPPQQPYGGGYQQPGQYPQQPPYGAPQHPGAFPPPPTAPKKSKTGLVIGAVAVVAALGVGAYFLFGGSGGNGAVADDTKGFKITPAASVGEYKKQDSKASSGEMSADDKASAEQYLGIKNPQKASASYSNSAPSSAQLPTGNVLTLNGMWGEISDPEKAIDGYFQKMKEGSGKDEEMKAELVGSPTEVTPSGFSGALMKCQNAKLTPKASASGLAAKSFEVPICVWADYSTIGGVNLISMEQITGAGQAAGQAEVADLAAKLYSTSRSKV
ncbi:hypothetical protein, partial [Streptomyces sp.]|uniref:hypothetical protein n=1 Tax=Streptomyces sp. TaxID=1931 RepID=UPI0028110ABD